MNRARKIDHKNLGLLAALVSLLVITGCGGGDSDGSTSASNEQSGGAADAAAVELASKSPSEAEFKKQASEICGRAGKAIVSALLQPPKGGSEAEAFEALNESVFLPTTERELSELAALGAPKGQEEQIQSILDAMQEGVSALNQGPITSLEAFGKAFAPYDQLMAKFGLRSCRFALA